MSLQVGFIAAIVPVDSLGTKTVSSQIIDEKSLIKKYQNEIRSLKEELDQLKRGIVTLPQLKDDGEDNIVLLKQKVFQYYF